MKSDHPREPAEDLIAQVLRDPLPTYAFLREHDPVAPVLLPGGCRAWLVSRYEDVHRGLSDPLMSNDQSKLPVSTPFRLLPSALRTAAVADVLHLDPPDHTRMRRLLAQSFSAQAADRMRPHLNALAHELIDSFADRPVVDLVAEYAVPFAGRSLADICGLATDEYAPLQTLANATVNSIHGADPSELLAPLTELLSHIRDLCSARKRDPGDDILSSLVLAHLRDELSEDELTSTIFGLLSAGQEGTANLIGNALHLLLTHDDVLDDLRAEPDLIVTAVEEFARYTAPLDLPIFRSSSRPTTFSGTAIPAGEPIMFSLLSSGHDEDRFAHATELDIRRSDRGHLAFGRGPHYCVGAPLARVQVPIALGVLLDRIGDGLELAVPPDQIRRRASVITRAVEALPVRLKPS